MASTTTNGLPFPESTDRVMDGAQAIENLAQALDFTRGWQTGTATIDAGTAGTARSVSVPFPRSFPRTPFVFVQDTTTNNSASNPVHLWTYTITKDTVSIFGTRSGGQAMTFRWFAFLLS